MLRPIVCVSVHMLLIWLIRLNNPGCPFQPILPAELATDVLRRRTRRTLSVGSARAPASLLCSLLCTQRQTFAGFGAVIVAAMPGCKMSQ